MRPDATNEINKSNCWIKLPLGIFTKDVYHVPWKVIINYCCFSHYTWANITTEIKMHHTSVDKHKVFAPEATSILNYYRATHSSGSNIFQRATFISTTVPRIYTPLGANMVCGYINRSILRYFQCGNFKLNQSISQIKFVN